MKKLLLVATVLCCFMLSKAQIPQMSLSRPVESYTETLDSIDGGWYKYRCVYDDHFNMKMLEYEENGYSYFFEFSYDEQNRLKNAVQTESESSFSTLTDYVYDSLDRRSEELFYVFENEVVTSKSKTVYQYNEDNNVSIVTDSYYSDYSGSWVTDSKLEYSYDDQLDIDEILTYEDYAVNDWVLTKKDVFTYDSNHNCIETKHYYREGNEWWLENETHNYYDLNVPSGNIAGLAFMFRNRFYINGINQFCRNKLLYSEDLRGKGDRLERNLIRLYYSTIAEIDENPEKPLNIWPNPVDKTLYFETAELLQVEIFSMEGRSLLMSDSAGPIDVSKLSAGCYLMKIIMKDGRITMQKFIKH